MKSTIIIPARYNSSRFPAKMMAKIAGVTMIQRVYMQACKSKADEVIIVTDHEIIFNHAKSFTAKVFMSKKEHESGTDRIAEVAENITSDLIINLQGDEPLMPPEIIDELIDLMQDSSIQMSTVAVEAKNTEDLNDPNCVKLVLNKDNEAIYFSRSCIPYLRKDAKVYLHWGIYAYTKDFLQQFVSWEQSLLEKAECLEQLRAIENKIAIKVLLSDKESIGIDTKEDLLKVEKMIQNEKI